MAVILTGLTSASIWSMPWRAIPHLSIALYAALKMTLRRGADQQVPLVAFRQDQNIFSPDKASVHLAHRFDPSHDWVPGFSARYSDMLRRDGYVCKGLPTVMVHEMPISGKFLHTSSVLSRGGQFCGPREPGRAGAGQMNRLCFESRFRLRLG